MKKKWFALLMAGAVLVSALSGCGTEKASRNNGEVSISIGNWPNPEADPKKYDVYKEKLKQFEKLYPEIEIITDEWQYDVKTFLPKAEGQTLPTLYETYFTEAKKIIELGYAAEVSHQMKANGYYDKINDYILENISRDGDIFLIPKSVYTLGLVLNLELFKEAGLMSEDGTPAAPKTFDELIETARIITEKTGKPGFVFPTTSNAGGWNFTVLAWNFGVKFMEQTDDGKWKATFDTPECIEALQYLKDLKWKYNVLPASTLIDNTEVKKIIGTDQGAMAFMGTGGEVQLSRHYGMSKDSIGFAKMPAGKDKHVTLMGGVYLAIEPNATPQQIDAVFKWLEFEGVTPNLTETTKVSLRKVFETKWEQEHMIGIFDLDIWNEKSEVNTYKKQLIREFRNININHISQYNDKSGIDYQTEEPVCAQDLYSILDGCIQEVLTNENADCAQLLKKAASDFQSNFLYYENR